MRYAVLFPGQGSQFVGMGADVFDVHDDQLGANADSILGWSLRSLCLEGPVEELTRTDHAQPALFAVSYALWSSFRLAVSEMPVAAAGHSLGEYTALAAAGAIGFNDALRLVARRGSLMAEAAATQPSGMAALLGADVTTAERVAAESAAAGGTIQVANHNAPGQVVVAGSVADLAWLEERHQELGVRRVVPLKVAGAFHSSYMAPAAERLAEEMSAVDFANPLFGVVANATASPHEAGTIADLLVEQVTAPVLFEESLRHLWHQGVATLVHIGPGDVTAGLAKRTLPDAEVLTVSSIEDIGAAAGALGTIDV